MTGSRTVRTDNSGRAFVFDTLLRLSANGNVVPISAFCHDENILDQMRSLNLIAIGDRGVTVADRISLAIEALRSGLTPERVAAYMSWKEFETFTKEAFEQNGYKSYTNHRFRRGRFRREIDVIGLRLPYIICADCKHWNMSRTSALRVAARNMVDRTALLQENIEQARSLIETRDWRRRILLSLVVTLRDTHLRLFETGYVVSIARLNDFILNIETIADGLPHSKSNL